MKKIYQIWHVDSFTDGGRGHKHFNTVLSREDAASFIDNRPGIQGRRRKWSEEVSGDWSIEEAEISESKFEKIKEQQKIWENAMTKLNSEEKELMSKTLKGESGFFFSCL